MRGVSMHSIPHSPDHASTHGHVHRRPTALLELDGLRLLTDPTFDPDGTDYPTAAYTLHKTQAPAVPLNHVPAIDAVLLSHDHHFDNLDTTGRDALKQAQTVYTTAAGAERLGPLTTGLKPW